MGEVGLDMLKRNDPARLRGLDSVVAIGVGWCCGGTASRWEGVQLGEFLSLVENVDTASPREER